MASDYEKFNIEDLQKMIADKRDALRAFRHASEGSHARNVREGRTLRREIAQIMTELRARDLPAGRQGLRRSRKKRTVAAR